jgi:hypothetical protein
MCFSFPDEILRPVFARENLRSLMIIRTLMIQHCPPSAPSSAISQEPFSPSAFAMIGSAYSAFLGLMWIVVSSQSNTEESLNSRV